MSLGSRVTLGNRVSLLLWITQFFLQGRDKFCLHKPMYNLKVGLAQRGGGGG